MLARPASRALAAVAAARLLPAPARAASSVVTMPALSPTMTSGKIARWTKKEGDKLSSGDVIGEVETDKATVDFVFQDEGFLAKLLVPQGAEDVAVGAPVCVVVDELSEVAAAQAAAPPKAAAAAAAKPAAPAAAVAAAAAAAAAPAPAAAAAAHSDASSLDASAVFPSARLLMEAHNVASSSLKGMGTGRGGRITKGDVLQLLGHIPAGAVSAAAAAVAAHSPGVAAAAVPAAAAASPAPSSPPTAASASAGSATSPSGEGRGFRDTKASTVRKVIASRLTESKAGIPHQYALMDCRIDAMMALRVQLAAAGVKVSLNDMVIKAAAKALRDVPEANCFYDSKSDSVRSHAGGGGAGGAVDVSVAVSTDGGLITPIVRGADALGLLGIGEKVKELAGRARLGKLKPEEFIGGSFTVSNLGMFGIDAFSAVINPPQACILAVGKGERKLVLPPFASYADVAPGAPVPAAAAATVMTVQLSSDARVVDAGVAGAFLQSFKTYCENPALLTA